MLAAWLLVLLRQLSLCFSERAPARYFVKDVPSSSVSGNFGHRDVGKTVPLVCSKACKDKSEIEEATDEETPQCMLVLALHGKGGNGPEFCDMLLGWGVTEGGSDAFALEFQPVCVACPSSIAREGWSLPRGKDSKFLLGLLDHIEAEKPIDKRAIHLVGYSLGAVYSFLLGCDDDIGFRFASIFPISGLPVPSQLGGCACRLGLHIALVHGTKDSIFPWNGWEGCDVEDYVERVVEDYGCADKSWTVDRRMRFHSGDKNETELYLWEEGCSHGSMRVYKMHGIGHDFGFRRGVISGNQKGAPIIWHEAREYFTKHKLSKATKDDITTQEEIMAIAMIAVLCLIGALCLVAVVRKCLLRAPQTPPRTGTTGSSLVSGQSARASTGHDSATHGSDTRPSDKSVRKKSSNDDSFPFSVVIFLGFAGPMFMYSPFLVSIFFALHVMYFSMF